ncbi:hypothetical protein B5S28_g384 [[Candida] boidinii]|uniref:Unnamed protein product n=1 Tax=Candida boidinii TaxID=5477 RepID=A0ACB5TF03_CANBO|nr:hypothetical protein B5S28_g384 [[Candida] boidinii]OWB62905.1 hypothetical protein B5S29_g3854 [[Candida] boidinii]OWB73786.1 hypothetical protein B5S31_g3548 [[Candida] boidinii]OWB78294.1 hypothetical protein B5S32_g2484 [[Candida] boidinii]GME87149.1 unnamed protein product [[Candida] boidinii]
MSGVEDNEDSPRVVTKVEEDSIPAIENEEQQQEQEDKKPAVKEEADDLDDIAHDDEEGEDEEEDDLRHQDDDDEDEEDEDDEDENTKRKRRRQNRFLDVEAEVDDEEEEEDDDEEAELLRKEFLADDYAGDEADGSAPKDDRSHRKLDRSREKIDEQDAQALADQFKARYGRSSSSRYMGSTTNVSQRLLLPSVDDPLIWGIRVRNGTEKEVVKTIYARMSNTKKAPEVFSAFQRNNFVGYVYIEARRFDAVNEIIKGMPTVYGSMQKILVPIEEYPDLLRPGKSTDVQLTPGSYVRMRTGKYKGDLGIVDNLAENDLEVRVKLVPRVDYGRSSIIDSANGADGKKGRPSFNSKFRPPQRLFSEIEASQYDPEHLSSARRDKGYFIYKNEEFINGFLYKDVKITQLDIQNIKPTLHELTLFNSGSGSEGIDLASIASTLKSTSEKSISFQPLDNVEIVGGEQTGMKGKILAAPDSKIVRVKLEGNNDPEIDNTVVEIPISNLRKIFLVGDHVKIIHGSHTDESGLIVKVESNQVTLVSDQTMNEINVFPNYLVKSTDTSTTSSKVGRFELHQLVQINATTVGLIIKAEKEIFTVLCTDGRVINIQPSAIQSALDVNRNTEKTTDKSGLEIKVGDVVKESSGERREGSILHIYRNYLFLKSRTISENTGIFVINSYNAQTVSNKGSILSTFKLPDLNKMNPSRNIMPPPSAAAGAKFAGRDASLGHQVSVRRGPYKGKKGIVKDTNGEVARVEMHAPSKIYPINKADLLYETRPGTYVSYEEFLGSTRGGRGGRPNNGPPGNNFSTPSGPSGSSNNNGNRSSWGNSGGRTPSWSSGGKTPSWSSGGKTPSWSSGGKTPSWSSGGKTPSWNSGNGGSKTPSWNSGGKTPSWNSGGGKTPAWNAGNRSEYGGASGNRSVWNPDSSSSSHNVPTPGSTRTWESSWGATPGGFISSTAPTPATPGAWDAPTPAAPRADHDDEDDYNPETVNTP